MKSFVMPAGIALAAAVLACGRTGAQEEAPASDVAGEPLWETGVVGVVGRIPHYPGSDEYRTYVLPLPFLIYRGEFLKIDRESLRGIFWKNSWGELNMSVSGNPPAEHDRARQGMPDLDPLLEIGPAWRVYLQRGDDAPELYLQAAVRGVISFDTDNLSPAYQGLRGDLSLQVSGIHPAPASPWRFGGGCGLYASDQQDNSYFYDVTAAQARPDRPAYHSDGGYGGFFLSAYTVRKLTSSISWSAYVRWDNLAGAVFEHSPLVRQENNLILGMALSWTFAQSGERVSK